MEGLRTLRKALPVKADIILEGDETRTVEVKERDGRYHVTLATPGEETLRELVAESDDRAGVASLRIGRQSYLVEVAEAEGRYTACIGSHCLECRIPTPRQRLRECFGGNLVSRKDSVETNMPGAVIEVFVEPGAQVAEGELIAIVEAMKIEDSIRAPRNATVAEVCVSAGDNVRAGQTIVTFEEEA